MTPEKKSASRLASLARDLFGEPRPSPVHWASLIIASMALVAVGFCLGLVYR